MTAHKNHVIGGKAFPYAYRHTTFRQGASGDGPYDRVRDWLDDTFAFSRHALTGRIEWKTPEGAVVARQRYTKSGRRQLEVYPDDAS